MGLPDSMSQSFAPVDELADVSRLPSGLAARAVTGEPWSRVFNSLVVAVSVMRIVESAAVAVRELLGPKVMVVEAEGLGRPEACSTCLRQILTVRKPPEARSVPSGLNLSV